MAVAVVVEAVPESANPRHQVDRPARAAEVMEDRPTSLVVRRIAPEVVPVVRRRRTRAVAEVAVVTATRPLPRSSPPVAAMAGLES